MAGSVFITDEPSVAPQTASPTTGPGAGTSPTGGDPGQNTLDMLTAIKNAPPENQKPGGQPYGKLEAVNGIKPDDPGQNTLAFLQGVKNGTLPPVKQPYETTPTSVGTNIGSGLSEGAIDTLGLPGDAIQGATNLVVRGINAATGSTLPTPESPIGSAAIKRGVGAATQPLKDAGLTNVTANPEDVQPLNAAEAIARGMGGGVASAIVPEAAVGGLVRAGAATVAPRVMQAAQEAFGTGSTATNAALGGVAGATGEAAAQAVPEPWQPTARLIGGIGGGLVGAVAGQVPGVVRSAVGQAKNFVEPMTAAGPQAIADRALATGLTDRTAAEQRLAGKTTGVGDVPQTTYQVTADPGAGAMERAAETGSPQGTIDFNARRTAQNEARVGVIKSLAPRGNPAAVSAHIRDQLADIDTMTAGIQRKATTQAQGAAAALPGQGTPEGFGGAMREGLAQSNAGAKAWEKTLWQAVDPDGTLAMGAAPISNAARRIEGSVPEAAKGPEGEEAAILKAAQAMKPVSKFSEVTALRSRISDEMRVQRGQNGNATTLARLTQLRGAVEKAIEEAAEHKAGQEVEAVKSGAMKPEETMVAKLQAEADAFKQAKSEAARPDNGGNSATARGSGSSGMGAPARTEVSPSGRSGDAAGDQGLSSKPAFEANLDADAANRIKSASTATKERNQTFRSGAVGETLAEKGVKDDYRILDSAVGQKFFKPGNSGAEAVKAFRTAVGNDPASMQALEGFAGLSLRKAAMNADGTLDPGKFAAWQKAHADALREMPDVAAKFATAAKASDAVADSTAMRAAALDGYQKGVLGDVLKVSDPGDVTKTIGSIFGKKDAISAMRQVVSEVKDNPDAREGLRKAIADFLTSKAISNTDDVKSDVFQTFVRQNRPVLAQVFSNDELKGIDAVAAELSRISRLANQAKLPNRSTTAQDLLTAKYGGDKHEGGLSLFAEMMIAGEGAGTAGAFTAGAPGAVVGAGLGAGVATAKHLIAAKRAAGMEKAQDLLRGMLLNPELARAALARVPAEQAKSAEYTFRQQLNRVAGIAASRMISKQQDRHDR